MTEVERQLQARLTPVLDELMPGPAPVAAIIRDGRRVRARRRLSSVTGLAAAAVLVIAAPSLPSLFSGPAVPPVTAHYHVTVRPPGPSAPSGLIASGMVNGAPWSVRAERGLGRGYMFTGVDIYVSAGARGNLPDRYAHGDPVQMFLGSATGPAIQVEAVRTDVTLVWVALTNGQVLALRPIAAISASRARLIAFAVPDYRDVIRITAFSNRSEIGYIVPWTGQSWFSTGRWLRPGQPAFPRPQTAVTGSGTAFGHSWRQIVAAGPWGWCGQGDVDGHGAAGVCIGALPPLRPGQYYQTAAFASGTVMGAGLIWSAQVADSVAVVELTTRSGQHLWIRPHRAAGRWFISFSSAINLRSGPAPLTVVRWAAFNQHHHLLAAGPADQT